MRLLADTLLAISLTVAAMLAAYFDHKGINP